MSDKFVSKFTREEINFSIVEASMETFCATLGVIPKNLYHLFQYLNLY